jgi:hypothetical protein
MAFMMYIPLPYSEKKYDEFTILHDGRFYVCNNYWRATRRHDGDFILYSQKRCRQFVVMMKIHVFDARDRDHRLYSYGIHLSTRREYRYMLDYLHFYCNKLKHRPFCEVKDVIMKHFLRLRIYLDSSMFQLIIFLHSCSTTFYDSELKDGDLAALRQCRQRLLTLSERGKNDVVNNNKMVWVSYF